MNKRVLGLVFLAIFVFSGVFWLKTYTATAADSITENCAVITQNLQIGSKGEDVVKLQKFLVSQGLITIPPGTSMGYLGPITKAALVKFQSANGIKTNNGDLDPVTRAQIALSSCGSDGAGTANNGNDLNRSGASSPNSIQQFIDYVDPPSGRSGTPINIAFSQYSSNVYDVFFHASNGLYYKVAEKQQMTPSPENVISILAPDLNIGCQTPVTGCPPLHYNEPYEVVVAISGGSPFGNGTGATFRIEPPFNLPYPYISSVDNTHPGDPGSKTAITGSGFATSTPNAIVLILGSIFSGQHFHVADAFSPDGRILTFSLPTSSSISNCMPLNCLDIPPINRSYHILVSNYMGNSNLVSFGTYVSPPTLNKLTPESGNPGTIVTVKGSGFSTVYPNTVYFGGTVIPSIFTKDPSTLSFTVPNLPIASNYAVRASSGGGDGSGTGNTLYFQIIGSGNSPNPAQVPPTKGENNTAPSKVSSSQTSNVLNAIQNILSNVSGDQTASVLDFLLGNLKKTFSF